MSVVTPIIKTQQTKDSKMTKDQKLQAVLDLFKEEAIANGESVATAWARLCGWLMSMADEKTADLAYTYYLTKESN
jgi:hypothetical protein